MRVTAVGAFALLAACPQAGGDRPRVDSSAVAAAGPADSAASTAPDTASRPVEGGSRLDASAGMPVLVGLTLGDPSVGPDFESLVFTFRATALPRYRVEYVTPPLNDCGQGNPVPVAGQALLHVRFEPTDAHADVDGRMQATVEREPALTGAVVKQVRRICDFEGVVEWGVGLEARRPFRVRELTAPPRLVVDLWRGNR
jgi:hypothetical protein